MRKMMITVSQNNRVFENFHNEHENVTRALSMT